MDIIKKRIGSESRKLNVKWSYDTESLWDVVPPKIDVSKLSKDQQADLIIERLSAPPKKSYNNELAIIGGRSGSGKSFFMANAVAEMMAAIDKEIINSMSIPRELFDAKIRSTKSR